MGVVWNYDSKTNTYKRANGGAPHNDKNTGKQIISKNVMVVFAKESPANDGYDGDTSCISSVAPEMRLSFKMETQSRVLGIKKMRKLG